MGQTWSAGGSIGNTESGGKKWRKKIGRTVVAVHSTVMVSGDATYHRVTAVNRG
jgi:hypothetical protein